MPEDWENLPMEFVSMSEEISFLLQWKLCHQLYEPLSFCLLLHKSFSISGFSGYSHKLLYKSRSVLKWTAIFWHVLLLLRCSPRRWFLGLPSTNTPAYFLKTVNIVQVNSMYCVPVTMENVSNYGIILTMNVRHTRTATASRFLKWHNW